MIYPFNHKKLDKKALRRSFWSSLSRVIGIVLGAGAGSLLHQMVGDGLSGWGFACGLAISSFFLMFFAEYEREVE
jgi:O-antigen/teichoic acid export membrane protein